MEAAVGIGSGYVVVAVDGGWWVLGWVVAARLEVTRRWWWLLEVAVEVSPCAGSNLPPPCPIQAHACPPPPPCAPLRHSL